MHAEDEECHASVLHLPSPTLPPPQQLLQDFIVLEYHGSLFTLVRAIVFFTYIFFVVKFEQETLFGPLKSNYWDIAGKMMSRLIAGSGFK